MGSGEKIVDKVYDDWWKGRDQGIIGLSLARRITDALREADLLSPVPLKLAHHRDHHDDEFHDGCTYCDWERENNDNYPAG